MGLVHVAICSCGWRSDAFEGKEYAINQAEGHQDEFPDTGDGPTHSVRVTRSFGGNWLRGGH